MLALEFQANRLEPFLAPYLATSGPRKRKDVDPILLQAEMDFAVLAGQVERREWVAAMHQAMQKGGEAALGGVYGGGVPNAVQVVLAFVQAVLMFGTGLGANPVSIKVASDVFSVLGNLISLWSSTWGAVLPFTSRITAGIKNEIRNDQKPETGSLVNVPVMETFPYLNSFPTRVSVFESLFSEPPPVRPGMTLKIQTLGTGFNDFKKYMWAMGRPHRAFLNIIDVARTCETPKLNMEAVAKAAEGALVDGDRAEPEALKQAFDEMKQTQKEMKQTQKEKEKEKEKESIHAQLKQKWKLQEAQQEKAPASKTPGNGPVVGMDGDDAAESASSSSVEMRATLEDRLTNQIRLLGKLVELQSVPDAAKMFHEVLEELDTGIRSLFEMGEAINNQFLLAAREAMVLQWLAMSFANDPHAVERVTIDDALMSIDAAFDMASDEEKRPDLKLALPMLDQMVTVLKKRELSQEEREQVEAIQADLKELREELGVGDVSKAADGKSRPRSVEIVLSHIEDHWRWARLVVREKLPNARQALDASMNKITAEIEDLSDEDERASIAEEFEDFMNRFESALARLPTTGTVSVAPGSPDPERRSDTAKITTTTATTTTTTSNKTSAKPTTTEKTRRVQTLPQLDREDQALLEHVLKTADPDFVKSYLDELHKRASLTAEEKNIEEAMEALGRFSPKAIEALRDKGLEPKFNNGRGLNCLFISLIQHATGDYSNNPRHIQVASRLRERLITEFGEEGDGLLPAWGPQFDMAVSMVNKQYRTNLDPLDPEVIVPSVDGTILITPAKGLGGKRVVLLLGNKGSQHFEAVAALAETAENNASTAKPAKVVQQQATQALKLDPAAIAAARRFDIDGLGRYMKSLPDKEVRVQHAGLLMHLMLDALAKILAAAKGSTAPVGVRIAVQLKQCTELLLDAGGDPYSIDASSTPFSLRLATLARLALDLRNLSLEGETVWNDCFDYASGL